MVKGLWLAIGLLLGAAIGYIPMYRENSNLETTLNEKQQQWDSVMSQLRARERLAVLGTRLGAVLVQAQQKNFSVARELSTKFFDSVREVAGTATDEQVKQTLNTALAMRDEITAELAMGSDKAVPQLMMLLLSIEQLVV